MICVGIPLHTITVIFYIITFQYKKLEQHCEKYSIAGDQFGGTMIAMFGNFMLIKKDSPEKFGNPKETISDNLGDNKKIGKFEPLGKGIADTLNKIDSNHVEKASENYESK